MQATLKNKDHFLAIGVMSGTSLDGLDLAAAEIWYKDGNWQFKLLQATNISYNEKWEQRLKQSPSMTGEELTRLHFKYGKFVAKQVRKFVDLNNLHPDLIASHGHTVFHQPDEGFTLQIGSGEVIAKISGIRTIADFRTGDVALGGQGAPLVPVGDRLLFSEYDFCLNLGGFANISFKNNGNHIAFDICPVNIVLNPLSEKFGLKFDRDGELGRQGKVDHDLLVQLNSLAFYSGKHPKSLGREWVEKYVFPILQNSSASDIDKLHTFYEHIAIHVAACVSGKGKMLVTGGGAFNTYLIERIKAHCSAEITLPEPELIEFKEALVFAFLGVLRWLGIDNCLASVTGASRNNSSGVIYLP